MDILADIFQEQTALTLIKTLVVGLVIGFTTGMTGIGGGVMTLPVLIHVVGLLPVTAVGTGLAYSMITKIMGTVFHWKQKTVNLSHTFYFLIGSVPGVLIASHIINTLFRISDRNMVNRTLQFGMAVLLLITAVIFFFEFPYLKERRHKLNLFVPRSESRPLNKKMLGLILGFIIGLLIGATSIGGGVLIIAVLLLLFNVRAGEAVGTSIVISVVLSSLGSIIYFVGGLVDLNTTFSLCLGAIPGVFWGSKMTVKIAEIPLKVVVLVLIILSGISLFF